MSTTNQLAALNGSAPPYAAALDRPFQCTQPDCTKSYTRAWLLRRHVKAEHDGIRFPCPNCPTVFKYENDLRQHQLRIHQGQRRYLCEKTGPEKSDCACGQSFATSSELYRHQRSNKAKVRGKRRARQQSAQEVIHSLSSCLQPSPRNDPEQICASIFTDYSSTANPTTSISLNRGLGQLHYSTAMRLRKVRKARKSRQSRGLRDTAQAHCGKGLLPHYQNFAHSIMRFEPTSSIELTLYSVRTYVFGSFDAGTWLATGMNNLCKSSKSLGKPFHDSIFDEVLDATRVLQDGDFQGARNHFSHICRVAKARIEVEEVPLIADLARVLLDHYLSAELWYKRPREASLVLVMRHCASLAATIHGSTHPLTTILKTLHKTLSDENPGPGLRIILKQLLSCLEQVLQPYHSLCIWLKLSTLDPEDAPLAKIWEFLESCDRVCGFDSYQSFYCLRDLICVRNISLHQQDVSGILESMATRIDTIQERDPELAGWYTVLSGDLKLQWLYSQNDWHGAAAVNEHEMIPLAMKRHGESSSILVAQLSSLEYCLYWLGDWARLEETRLWRKAVQERLFAEENNEDGCWDDCGYGDISEDEIDDVEDEDGDEDEDEDEDEEEDEDEDEDEGAESEDIDIF